MKNEQKLLLIGPTALDMSGQPIKQRRLHLPGLTLPMLAAVTPSHYAIRLVNETVEDIPFDEHWDLVGITGMGSGLVRAWQIADEFRARGVTVIIGGIAASLCGPEWSLSHADALVVGEAEDTWPRLIADFDRGNLRQIYRMETPPKIDALPLPRYDLMNPSKLGFWRPVQATRGCPFTCTFCSITAFHSASYRKRPVEDVVRDVRAAKSFGTSHIAFIDDNIGVDWKYCQRLWEALIPERIIWMSQCSLHIADRPDMLALAAKSGCRLLSFGIESTNELNLISIEKRWNKPTEYVEAIKQIRQHGIDVSTEMIVGLDCDDQSVFENTYEFLKTSRVSIPRVHILTPVPGTPLYRKLEAEGRLVHRDFGRYSGGQVVFKPARMSAEELQSGYWKLYERLFSVKNILTRVGRNRAGLNSFMRALVIGTNIHYRNHVQRRITPGIV